MGCAGRIQATLFKWLNSASHSALRSGHPRLVISLPKTLPKKLPKPISFRTLTPPWRLVRPCGCLAGLSHPNPLLTRAASHADAFSSRSLTLLSPRHRYWALNQKAPAAPHPTPRPRHHHRYRYHFVAVCSQEVVTASLVTLIIKLSFFFLLCYVHFRSHLQMDLTMTTSRWRHMKHLSGPACMPTHSTSRCFFFFLPRSPFTFYLRPKFSPPHSPPSPLLFRCLALIRLPLLITFPSFKRRRCPSPRTADLNPPLLTPSALSIWRGGLL